RLAVSLILLYCASAEQSLVCKTSDKQPCKCDLLDGSGIIDISPLGYQNKSARWNNINGPDSFTYFYNPCYSFTYQDLSNLALLQTYPGAPAFTLSIGTQDTALFVKDGDKIAINYTAPYNFLGSSLSYSQVLLTCDPKIKNGQEEFSVISVDDDSYYTFEVKGESVCPTKSNHSLSGGSVLLIIFFVLLFVYLVGGILYNRYKNEKTGLDMIPNREFWSSLPGLIADGVKFIFSGCKKSPTTYDNI
uniref:Cation-dependent mannose-6-phosphate receptor n=1 Tax=Ciona savignyi TaxID=51511 RepID=H2Z8L3_CIOSA